MKIEHNLKLLAITALCFVVVAAGFLFTAIPGSVKQSPTDVLGAQSLNGTIDSQSLNEAYFVSPDGQMEPSADACANNKGINGSHNVHFHRIKDGLACLKAGGILVINAEDMNGVKRAYDESGLGSASSPIASGSAAKQTRIVGRCNADVAFRNMSFTKTSCKPLIKPTPATWGANYSKNMNIWSLENTSYVKLINIEMSADSIGLTASGQWDGTTCGCWANSAVAISNGSHHITLQQVKVHHMPGNAVSITAGDKSLSTSVLVHDSEFYHNGWNYPASDALRFGDATVHQDDTPVFVINGRPAYWTHLHSIAIAASDNEISQSYFYDDAGSSIQFIAVPAERGIMTNNTIQSSYFASSGWKARDEISGDNNPQAGLLVGNTSGLRFYNNIVFNMPGVQFELLTDSGIYNNSFIYNDKSNNSITSLTVKNSSRVGFYNNLLCYNREAAAIRDGLNLENGSKTQFIAENGLLGKDQLAMLLVNTNNVYGACKKQSYFKGFSDGGIPVISLASKNIKPEAFILENDLRTRDGGTSIEAPATDFYGNERIDAPDIGAIEYGSKPPAPEPVQLTRSATVGEKIAFSIPASSPVQTACQRFEAEDGTLSGGADSARDVKGYSGYAYVQNWGLPDSTIEFKGIELPLSGTYSINLRYVAGYGDSQKQLIIDGIPQETITYAVTLDWQSWQSQMVEKRFEKGSHSIALKSRGGKYALADFVDVCLTEADTAQKTSVGTRISTTDPQHVSEVQGRVYMHVDSQTSSIKNVVYSVDSAVVTKTNRNPFVFDTTILANGRYLLEEKVTFTDGRTTSYTATIIIRNQTAFYSPVVRFARKNKIALISIAVLVAAITILLKRAMSYENWLKRFGRSRQKNKKVKKVRRGNKKA